MRPSIISERRFDGAMRHTWRQPLPPIDQANAQLAAAPVRGERPVADQGTRLRPSTPHPN